MFSRITLFRDFPGIVLTRMLIEIVLVRLLRGRTTDPGTCEGGEEVVDQQRVATKSRALIILSKHFRCQLTTHKNDTTFIRKEKNQAKKAVASCISGCHVVFPLLHSPPLLHPTKRIQIRGKERAGTTTPVSASCLSSHCHKHRATIGSLKGLRQHLLQPGLLLASSHSLVPSTQARIHQTEDAFVAFLHVALS